MANGWCVKDECPYPHPQCKNRCKEADKELTQIRTTSNHPDPRMNLDLGFSGLPKFQGEIKLVPSHK